MAVEEFAAIEAEISALDQATACRVARLVVECGASVSLALLAVQDAISSSQPRPNGTTDVHSHNALTNLRAWVTAWQ